VIYFILAGHKTVKIGYSADPNVRLKDLATGNPFELKLLGTMPGQFATEKELHRIFDRFRLQGEWFRYDGQLRDCLDAFRWSHRKHETVTTVRQFLENGVHWHLSQKAKRNNKLKERIERY
jgi:hypothetical protein